MNLINTDTTVDQSKLNKLREMVLSELRDCPSKYDSRDLKVIEDSLDAYPCLMFLESNEWHIDPAFEAMVRHSVWRKENGVLDLKATDFPKEIHRLYLFHPFGKDVNGNPAFFIQTSIPPGPKENHSTMLRHFLWASETIGGNVVSASKKPVIVFDCRSPQVDISLLRQVLDIFTSKYPPTAEYIAFLDMNFAFKLVVNIIKYFFPKSMWKRMIFIDQNQLRELFDEDNLPPYLGGKSIGVPEATFNLCPPFDEYYRREGVSEKGIAKIEKFFSTIQTTSNNNNN